MVERSVIAFHKELLVTTKGQPAERRVIKISKKWQLWNAKPRRMRHRAANAKVTTAHLSHQNRRPGAAWPGGPCRRQRPRIPR